MFIEFKTIITHRIEVGGEQGIEDVRHSVDIEAGEAADLGEQIIYAVVVGGCKSTITAIEAGQGKTVVVEDDDAEV